jgi:hypothetical protein
MKIIQSAAQAAAGPPFLIAHKKGEKIAFRAPAQVYDSGI